MDDRLTNEGEIKELDNPISDEYDEQIEFIDKLQKDYGIGIVSISVLNKIMKELTIETIKKIESGKETKI